MIDFTNCKEILKNYGGSEQKKAFLHQRNIYMVKFPDRVRAEKNDLSYMNNQFSEHIGSSIFRLSGFETQETFLGEYLIDSEKKIVVACQDFLKQGEELIEFSSLVNADIRSPGKSPQSIEMVERIIENTQLIGDKTQIMEKFWDMFVVDALIGNGDRHYSNWGIVSYYGELRFAPIYDCGSSLAALVSDDRKEELLRNETEFRNMEYNAMSVYRFNKKKIFYHEIFKNPPEALVQAKKRVIPRIPLREIIEFIENIEILSDIYTEYIIKSLKLRYTEILLK